MPKLTTFERIVNLFNKLPYNTKNKNAIISHNAANKYGIFYIKYFKNILARSRTDKDIHLQSQRKCIFLVLTLNCRKSYS